jgi:hypothetical protein
MSRAGTRTGVGAAAAAVAAAAGLASALPTAAWASAEGPATPQAVAAHAEFLATTPAPPGGAAAVCVIDSGVDTNTDLGPALVKRSAFDAGTPDDLGAKSDQSTPLPKHGTYVAGVIASQIDGVGTNGIWPAARVLSRRVFAGPTSGTTANDYIRAIQWCINDPADQVKVINLSLSGLSATLDDRASLEDKIGQVRRPPYSVNVVAAAGNGGLEHVGYPGSGAGVFSVGATDTSGALAPFSNRGPDLDISTFGTGTCLTTGGGSRLGVGEGTSYSAPIVSAVLAALRSYRSDLSPDQAERLLLDHGGITTASAQVDAAAAFRAAGLAQLVPVHAPAPRSPCFSPPAAAAGDTASPFGIDSAEPLPSAAAVAGDDARVVRVAGYPAPVVDALPSPKGQVHGGPTRPTLRSIAFRRGVLDIRVSGLGPGQQAVFHVDGERRVRTHGELRIRVRRWRRVRVVFEMRLSPGKASAPLKINHALEF